MNIKKLAPHAVAVVVFLVTVIVMFLPQFQGKALQQGDIMQYRGASREITDFRDQTGERTNWTNAMFGGMPTYQISAVSEGNKLLWARRAFFGFMNAPAGYVFCGMLTFYLLMILLGVNHWLALSGAIISAVATNNIVLYEAGHVSKLGVLMQLPLVAAGVLMAFRRYYLSGAAVFALGMGLAILFNHPQMLYYFGLTLPFLGVAELIRLYQRGELTVFFKAMGALLVGLALAIGAGASNLLTTTEYLPQSIRGGSVLSAPAAQIVGGADAGAVPGEGTRSGGLEWTYAMAWSNGFKDMLATYAPMAAGGGSGQEVERGSAFGQAMVRSGFQVPATFPAPLYHGSLPFTEGPIYLGAVAWALFLFGLFTASTTIRIWLAAGVGVLFILSLGINAEFINRPLFDYLPLLNNFRTPNSALSIAAFLMVALGMFGIHRWAGLLATDRVAAGAQLKRAGITAAALGVLIILMGSFIDYNAPQDAAQLARFTQGQGDVNQLVGALVETRREVYADDAWRSFLFVGLTFGVLYLWYRTTLSFTIAALALGAVGLIDFVGVNRRYLTHDDFQSRRQVVNAVQPTPADEQILQDPDPHYRVLNLSRDLDKDAFTSYFHNSLGGYSAVKLRRYQDILEGYLVRRDLDVISMLNGKYILAPGQDGQLQAQRNPNAFGNAWLVDEVERVDGPDAAFAALGTVEDLRQTAIIEPEYADAVAGLDPSGRGSVELTSYAPNELVYDFSSDGEQLVVFSEIWYGPDLGWRVTIDGEPAELIRANYTLRAVRVPAGEHRITMTFAPASFATGTTISLICSLLILGGVIFAIAYPFFRDRNTTAVAT